MSEDTERYDSGATTGAGVGLVEALKSVKDHQGCRGHIPLCDALKITEPFEAELLALRRECAALRERVTQEIDSGKHFQRLLEQALQKSEDAQEQAERDRQALADLRAGVEAALDDLRGEGMDVTETGDWLDGYRHGRKEAADRLTALLGTPAAAVEEDGTTGAASGAQERLSVDLIRLAADITAEADVMPTERRSFHYGRADGIKQAVRMMMTQPPASTPAITGAAQGVGEDDDDGAAEMAGEEVGS